MDIEETMQPISSMPTFPVLSRSKIEISAQNGMLQIKGSREAKFDETKEGVHRIERSYGSFMRQFTLPEDVKAEDVTAKTKNGELEILLPKSTPSEAKRITVES